MGCLGKFLLSALALWGFSTLGWITMAEGASIWWAAFWVMLVILFVDLIGVLLKVVVQTIALPISVLTFGCAAVAIEAVFKYIGLYLAASWTHMFFLPWILGAFWWQALLIGLVFAIISGLTSGGSSSSSSSDSNS